MNFNSVPPRDNKFTLGTAQLGLDYGLANQEGMLSNEHAYKLLEKALQAGIRHLDTARVYGLSEQRIGNILQVHRASPPTVISKLHPLQYLSKESSEGEIRQEVRKSIFESLDALKVTSIDILLLHRWQHRYQWSGAIWQEIIFLQQDGLIKKIGSSVSTPEEVKAALKEPMIKHIQCPVNILDYRWHEPELLTQLKQRNDVDIFARSVYLQGLLLMPAAKWPQFAGVDILALNHILDQLVLKFKRENRQDLCISYVRGLPWVASLVLGVEAEGQLIENLGLFEKEPLSLEQIEEIQQIIPHLSDNFLNPALWAV